MTNSEILFLDAETTLPLLDWRNVVPALKEAYAAPMGPAQSPPRVVARGNGVWLRALAAVSPSGRYMGAKLFGLSRSKGVNYVVVLFDQQSGTIAAFVDAKELTAARTAATSAIAVDCMAPRHAVSMALLGSGAEAEAHARAIATVRPVESLRVFSPTPAKRQALAARLAQDLKTKVDAVDSAEQALRGSSLVVAAARSFDESPILKGAWLKPGMLVVSIGSTLPEQREVDSEVVRLATVIVADAPEEVAHETGDMLQAAKDGVTFADKLVPLADVVSGRRAAGAGPGDISMFKSVGSALQDIAVAEMCLDLARERGLGRPMPMGFALKQV